MRNGQQLRTHPDPYRKTGSFYRANVAMKAPTSSFDDLSRSRTSRDNVVRTRPEGHSPLIAVVTLIAFLSSCTALILYSFRHVDYGYTIGLYKNNSGLNSTTTVQIHSRHAVDVMTFISCCANVIWTLYATTLLCRRSTLGPLYVYPSPVPGSVYPLMVLVNGIVIGQPLLWDRGHLEVACLFDWLAAAGFLFVMGLASKHLANQKKKLLRTGNSGDFWATQILSLNTLGFSAGFYIVLANIELAIVLAYGKLTSVSSDNATRVALSILSLLILIHAVLDFFYFDKWTRYIVTPYVPIITALIGACIRHWQLENVTIIFAAALLCTCVIGIIIKLIFTVARHIKDPPKQDASAVNEPPLDYRQMY